MNGKKLLESLSGVDEEIINEAQTKMLKKSKKNFVLPLVACFAVLFVSLAFIPQPVNKNKVPNIEIASPGMDAPMGIRKFMIYNNSRYAFLENGSTYKIDKKDLAEKLGTLEYDIVENPQVNSDKNFATSFAFGGTVYKASMYDENFRVIVEHNSEYYIAERVDSINDDVVSVSEYFETANFMETVKEIHIYDHFGRNLLDKITSDKKAKEMLSLLEECKPVNLTNEEYEQIGKAQSSGKSFLLFFKLNDGTDFKMYVIPSLKIAMLGDNRYALSDEWINKHGELFENLKQEPLPIQ